MVNLQKSWHIYKSHGAFSKVMVHLVKSWCI